MKLNMSKRQLNEIISSTVFYKIPTLSGYSTLKPANGPSPKAIQRGKVTVRLNVNDG